MTGSESLNSSSKGSRRPKAQQQGEDSCKADVPTDQLRRLAIKNSYGNKSLSPSSLLLSRAISSSTSSLHQLEPLRADLKPGDAQCPTSSSLHEKEHQQPKNSRCSPYITRQELLHSLRRTSSNHSVGMMQTICCGNSSYIHHTPRHLTRTHFNPKAPVARSATITPDSGLWSADDVSLPGDKLFDRVADSNQETQSLVNMAPPSRQLPIMPPRRSRQKQRSQRYVGVELTDSPSSNHPALEKRKDILMISQQGAGHGYGVASLPGVPRVPPPRKSPSHSNTRCGLEVPSQGVYTVSSRHEWWGSNSRSPSTSPTRSSVSPRHVTMRVDSKIKLHIPQGRKIASLV